MTLILGFYELALAYQQKPYLKIHFSLLNGKSLLVFYRLD